MELNDYLKSCQDSAAKWLVHKVKQWDKMSEQEREGPVGTTLYLEIRAAGHAASFFGGYDGMKALHDACEDLVDDDNSVGGHLNHLWDMIGGWLS